MKVNGQSFDGPNEVILVLPKNGMDVVFKARAILDFSHFDSLCPKPTPRTVSTPKGPKILFDEKSYETAFDAWGTKKTSYIVIKSLEATEGLEWDKVDINNPETWNDYRKEFTAAFFSDREIQRIVNIVWEANGIDEEKLEEARARFLAGLARVKNTETSHLPELKNTQSGELANGSESNRPAS